MSVDSSLSNLKNLINTSPLPTPKFYTGKHSAVALNTGVRTGEDGDKTQQTIPTVIIISPAYVFDGSDSLDMYDCRMEMSIFEAKKFHLELTRVLASMQGISRDIMNGSK